MCAYSVFNTFPVYPLSAKPLILLAFCRYRYHTSLFELPVKDTLYLAQREAICNLAAGGPCVIVGRGACEVLKGRLPLLRVFIYADMETKIRRVVEEYQELPENAEKRLYAVDKKRMAYYSFYEKKEKERAKYFDICIDSGSLGIDGAVQVILSAYR